jgi:hypothetical protein
LGDQIAAWVYVESRVTQEEYQRVVNAYPEAKLFLRRGAAASK